MMNPTRHNWTERSSFRELFRAKSAANRLNFLPTSLVLLFALPWGLAILPLLSARAQAARSMPGSARAGDGATITFRKIFKSSYPEFVEIKVRESGSGTFDIRQLDEEANPQPFEIGAPLLQKILDLTGKLHDFQGVDLEVHRRLANLGEKTFGYQKGGETHEVTFNYTLDSSATQLLNIFEGLSREESDLSDLQRTMRYDHLGVNDVLVQIDADYNNKLLPEPERFLTTLDRLAEDQKYIDIARERARTLAGRIRISR
jgi:hypothetical protein